MSAVDVRTVDRFVAAARASKRAFNRIRSGQADRVHPRYFGQDALVRGTMHELEHTRTIAVAMEIAMDHLLEDPLYYRKLEKLERKPARKQTRSHPEPGRRLSRFVSVNSRAWGDR